MVKFVIFLASLNNKILQKVSLIVKIMIEIKKEKKLWNNYQTWDKTKAYKSSKLGEKDLMFEKFFFFKLSFSCVITIFKLQPIGSHFFLSFSLCQSPLHSQRNFRWSQGGRCPPSPPSGSATGYIYLLHHISSCGLHSHFTEMWISRKKKKIHKCGSHVQDPHAKSTFEYRNSVYLTKYTE